MQTTHRLEIKADTLRAKRLGCFMTQEDLVVASGISLAKIKQIEAGTGEIVRPSTAKKLAGALNCSNSDLARVVQEQAS